MAYGGWFPGRLGYLAAMSRRRPHQSRTADRMHDLAPSPHLQEKWS
jgi:hypothetical protein